MESKLNIQLTINESGLTPDSTFISESMSINIEGDSVSTSRKEYNAGTTKRLYKNGYTGAKDKMFYIKNIGTTDFTLKEATLGGAVGNEWGSIKSGDVMLFRLRREYDLWLVNTSSSDKGIVEYSYWECKENTI
tara:strand:- start:245 stop:646 length:402 start_codon:yes stop_codon:yes gene_type:complete